MYRPAYGNEKMPNQDSWQLALSEYIRQGEPDRAEKSAAWQTAIGLQTVDGLKTSPYLLETAKAHPCHKRVSRNVF